MLILKVKMYANKKNRPGGTGNAELRGCVKVEVAVLGSQSLIVPTVSVGVKQH